MSAGLSDSRGTFTRFGCNDPVERPQQRFSYLPASHGPQQSTPVLRIPPEFWRHLETAVAGVKQLRLMTATNGVFVYEPTTTVFGEAGTRRSAGSALWQQP
jgi:hypothetical protein